MMVEVVERIIYKGVAWNVGDVITIDNDEIAKDLEARGLVVIEKEQTEEEVEVMNDEQKAAFVDYNKSTVAELREMANEMEVELAGGANKNQIIHTLIAHEFE